VLLVGALASASHVGVTGSPATAAHLTSARLPYPGQVRSGLTEGPAPAGQAARRRWFITTSDTVSRPQLARRARHRSSAAGHQASAATARTLTCSGPSSGPLPANYQAIASFLLAHGYTGNAAAGIAGNIYQESMGNPESVGTGGGGLIGWTPLPAGFVTGNPAADLQTQLAAVLTFNQLWSQYIPALNAAASPAQAADIYVTDFERAGIPAASSREAAATAVAAACGL
jgi:hypothetical protein